MSKEENRKEFEFESSNKVNIVKGVVWLPKEINKAKGIIQIVHGMCEYIEKYDDFASFLTKKGYIVCGHNHIGHGSSINGEDELGYFAKENGYHFLIRDTYHVTRLMKKEYPNIPYLLLGHSMGSFIARGYVKEYGDKIDALMLSGTGGKNPFIDLGINICKRVIAKRGEKYHSKYLEKIVIGSFNSKFIPHRTKYDWLTRDEEKVDEYVEDKLSGFSFTASAYLDLFRLHKNANEDKWFETVRKDLPIYIFSGAMDPVGDYGKGVTLVFEKLKEAGVKDVSIRLYEDARHETLNEINKKEVYQNVLNWIERTIALNKKV